MTVHLHSGSFQVTPALLQFAEGKLEKALGKYNGRIQGIALRMDDINGPRGGEDKRVRVTVALARAHRLHIEEVGTDLYRILSSAVERTASAVAHQLGRWRSKEERSATRKRARNPVQS